MTSDDPSDQKSLLDEYLVPIGVRMIYSVHVAMVTITSG